MNYVSWPLLEYRALLKIAIMMWNSRDIRHLVSEFVPPHSHGPLEQWQRMENQVKGKVSQLRLSATENFPEHSLPSLLQNKLFSVINVIGSHILAWKDFHYRQCNFTALPKEFIWTTRGTIDKIKTIEVVITDENVDISQRYVLACTYCLVNHIHKLREEVDDDDVDARYAGYSSIVSFWFNRDEEEMAELGNIENVSDSRLSTSHFNAMYRDLFFRAISSGNEPATRFFLKRLSRDEQDIVLRCMRVVAGRISYSLLKNAWYSVEYSADVLCFLLSDLTREQKIQVFSDCSYEILACYLEWPHREFFMEIARDSWTFLPQTDYHSVLQRIADKIVLNIKDYDYKELFMMFWKESPPSHRNFVAELCRDGILLSKLLRAEDQKNMELILKHEGVSRKDLITHIAKDAIEDLVWRRRFDILEFFLRKCQPPISVIRSFKEQFMPFIPHFYRRQIAKKDDPKLEKDNNWSKFYELLDRCATENE